MYSVQFINIVNIVYCTYYSTFTAIYYILDQYNY